MNPEREKAAGICDLWAMSLIAAGDQFDKDGDIYNTARLVKRIAADIRAGGYLASPFPKRQHSTRIGGDQDR